MPRLRVMVFFVLMGLSGVASPAVGAGGGGALPDNDTLMKALVEELARSMEGLTLGDLPTPYFIQLNAEDRLSFDMRAAHGKLQRSERNRFRAVSSRVRVGTHELDNTNVGRAYGGRGSLPLDDDIAALRHVIWRMLDRDYKGAVEALARKEAYLREKTVKDRPDDFAPGNPVTAVEPSAEIAFDEATWAKNIEQLSARFKAYPAIQDSSVSFFAGAVNNWVVNAEGTRVRYADTGAYIQVRASTQAVDGMPLSDRVSYVAMDVGGLPTLSEMSERVDRLCADLDALRRAPVLEHYTGPVLFEADAAGLVFDALLATRLCARPIPVGSGGSADRSFEKKIGLRVLPKSFSVYDDPGPIMFEGAVLAGAYSFDDEAVRPRRVSLVENGMLQTLLASRAPTRKIKRTTGHGRSGGYGDATAHIGCLYISDANGVSYEDLRAKLIEAACDEGLTYGLRVASLAPGGYGSLGTPIHIYKVHVEDGREERIRGMEFGPVPVSSLKRILAAGRDRKVYNSTMGVSSSIVAPALLFDEIELNKIEREFDKLPILKSPVQRGEESS